MFISYSLQFGKFRFDLWVDILMYLEINGITCKQMYDGQNTIISISVNVSVITFVCKLVLLEIT